MKGTDWECVQRVQSDNDTEICLELAGDGADLEVSKCRTKWYYTTLEVVKLDESP
jgi:hypothetical protein